jgi:hypothetical protein
MMLQSAADAPGQPPHRRPSPSQWLSDMLEHEQAPSEETREGNPNLQPKRSSWSGPSDLTPAPRHRPSTEEQKMEDVFDVDIYKRLREDGVGYSDARRRATLALSGNSEERAAYMRGRKGSRSGSTPEADTPNPTGDADQAMREEVGSPSSLFRRLVSPEHIPDQEGRLDSGSSSHGTTESVSPLDTISTMMGSPRQPVKDEDTKARSAFVSRAQHGQRETAGSSGEGRGWQARGGDTASSSVDVRGYREALGTGRGGKSAGSSPVAPHKDEDATNFTRVHNVRPA